MPIIELNFSQIIVTYKLQHHAVPVTQNLKAKDQNKIGSRIFSLYGLLGEEI
jgi:hypothetical protein